MATASDVHIGNYTDVETSQQEPLLTLSTVISEKHAVERNGCDYHSSLRA